MMGSAKNPICSQSIISGYSIRSDGNCCADVKQYYCMGYCDPSGQDNCCSISTCTRYATYNVNCDSSKCGGTSSGGDSEIVCRCPGVAPPDPDCVDTGDVCPAGSPGGCGTEDSTKWSCPCETKTTFYKDNDGDNYGNPSNSKSSCSQPSGYVLNNDDCDDNNKNINPIAPEICDGRDNNCNNQIDEGVKNTCTEYSTCQTYQTCNSCPSPPIERCDGIDNNCDGTIDEGNLCPTINYYCDYDGDEFLSSTLTTSCNSYNCMPVVCSRYPGNDCNDNDKSINPNIVEICGDGIDNNCDSNIDEGLKESFFLDSDDDGFGDANYKIDVCPGITPNDYVKDNTDCDDSNKNTFPGASEICDDNIDNDCDGNIDEGCSCTSTQQNQKCGYSDIGECQLGFMSCNNGVWSECLNAIYPEKEICDSKDNDCDGLIDEECDKDKDGYLNKGLECIGSFMDGKGVSKSCSEFKDDCDDNNLLVYPKANETCDGLDNDCNGKVDDIQELPYCYSLSHFGLSPIGVCKDMRAYCDSFRKSFVCLFTKWEVIETSCDKLDNDCDGLIDENCDCDSGEEKACGSDVGECQIGLQKCESKKWTSCQNSINPSEEICDGKDNDCDNSIDENLIKECYVDSCTGKQSCIYGQWTDCKAECTNQFQILITSDDLGNFVIDGGLSKDEIKNSLNTLKVVNQTVAFSYDKDTTTIKNSISSEKQLKDFEYTLQIPKCLSEYLDNIDFENKQYEIIKNDPIIAWHFVNVNGRVDLSYKIKGKIDAACLQQIKGLPIAKQIQDKVDSEKNSSFTKFIMPSLIIVIVLFVFFYMQRIHPNTEPKVKNEQDYENEFLEKQKKELLKKIKEMKFKNKEQADKYMKQVEISEANREWILKRL